MGSSDLLIQPACRAFLKTRRTPRCPVEITKALSNSGLKDLRGRLLESLKQDQPSWWLPT